MRDIPQLNGTLDEDDLRATGAVRGRNQGGTFGCANDVENCFHD
jgi:hypothetical protein